MTVLEVYIDDGGALEYTIKENTSDTLDAWIQSIDRYGNLKVVFS